MPVGTIIFPRDPNGRNQGRMMGCRKKIASIEGLVLLDFEMKPDGTKFRARCQGSLQAVEAALKMMIEDKPGAHLWINVGGCALWKEKHLM